MKMRALALASLAVLLLRPGIPRYADSAIGTKQAPKGLTAGDWSSIQAEYERNRHAAVPEEGGYRARNHSQQWMTHFDGRGFTVQPNSGQWSWGLELRRYGFAGQEQPVTGGARATSERDRIRYAWGAIEEWFVNDGRGLEHGFTLQQRPAGANSRGALRMHLGVRGGLRPQVTQDGGGVRFVDASGRALVTYAGLKVWDAAGKALPARFEPADDITGLSLAVEEDGAQYPLTIDPIAQQAYLKASNTGAGDLFGRAVAVSGNTVVVGALNEDSNSTGVNGDGTNNAADGAGSAYVFVRNGGVWTQQAYLKASNTGSLDAFGAAVAVAGDTVVVGAPNEDSNATGVDGDGTNNGATNSGAAYVFVRSGTTWSQQAYLKASNTGASDLFGGSVSVFGDTVVVGAPSESSNATGVNGNQADNSASQAGAAYVFVRSGTTWTQQAYLKASNTGASDSFGGAVSVWGETVVVGADGEDSNASGVNGDGSNNAAPASGAAYVFVRSGTTWTQQAYLKASNTGNSDGFGWSVGVSADTIVVGAPNEASIATGVNGNQADNSALAAGAAYIFVRSGTTWSQQAYLKASNTAFSDSFGWSVGIWGDTVVSGAYLEDSNATGVNGNQADNSASASGAAYLFTRNGTTWTQQAYLKASNAETPDNFGFSVAVGADTAVVGAISEDGGATGVNGSDNNNAADSGAAYAFGFPQVLGVSKTHVGAFTQGQSGATYTVTVTNTAISDPTWGTVTVTETVPAGLTFVSMAGTGWTCIANTCTRNDALPGGSSYPAITVTVNVSVSAPAQVTNQVTVSGGGAADASASDSTTINQNGCNFTLNPPSATVAEGGGNGAVGVTTGVACQWTAVSNASWLTITSQASGTGNGSFNYSVAVNPNGTPRSGTISVNGTLFTVTQSPAGGGAPLALRFIPVTPCRIADTRNPDGPFGGPALGASSPRDFVVPLSACNIPASAVAYSFNMTVVPPGVLGFLSVWPAGVSQPSVSTLNSLDGRVKANAAVVPAGLNGAVTVFASHPTHVIVDVNGYFVPVNQSQGLAFYTVPPCRLADTRFGTGTFAGPALAASVTRTFPVRSGSCGVPANAQAYAMSMTVVPPGPLFFLTAWPTGFPQPAVSTLNSYTGTVVSNLAIVPAGTNGAIDVVVTNPTDLLIDVTGYFAPPGSAGALDFYPATPCRIVDTRGAVGPFGGPRMEANETRGFQVPLSSCNVPGNVKAYSFNATVVPPASLGFLTLWGSGAMPGVSTLNSYDGAIVANAAITTAGTNGMVTAFSSHATHLILDINGYFR